MIIDDLKKDHPIIHMAALDYQLDAGNVIDGTLDLSDNAEKGGFDWYATEEGVEIWKKVNEGNFEPWYEFMGRDKKQERKLEKTFVAVDSLLVPLKDREDNVIIKPSVKECVDVCEELGLSGVFVLCAVYIPEE